MQKFIISVKEKNTGRDVISPYIINSLDGLGNYSERVSPLGYYSSQQTLEDMENFIIGKWMDLLKIDNKLYKRWK